MRKLAVVVCLILLSFIIGCQDITEAVMGREMSWNTEPLGEPWASEFRAAMAWWGEGMSRDPGSQQRAEWMSNLGVRAAYWPSRPRRIYFNDTLTWDLDSFCYAARHELGHFLGYGHSDDPNSIMYPVPGKC